MATDLSGYTLYRGTGEWSALYDDQGKLVEYGDHYVVDEKIHELTGITLEHSNDFLTNEERTYGTGARARTRQAETAFSSLEALQAARDERDRRARRAAELRAQATAIELGQAPLD